MSFVPIYYFLQKFCPSKNKKFQFLKKISKKFGSFQKKQKIQFSKIFSKIFFKKFDSLQKNQKTSTFKMIFKTLKL
jgi:hypothetical protein